MGRDSHLPSISSTLNAWIFRTNVVLSSYLYIEKMTFVRKIRTYYVDEIDTWGQFPYLFMSCFDNSIIHQRIWQRGNSNNTLFVSFMTPMIYFSLFIAINALNFRIFEKFWNFWKVWNFWILEMFEFLKRTSCFAQPM